MKVSTIKLSHGHAPTNPSAYKTATEWEAARRYRVEQVTDSIEFSPGQLMERDEVEALCASIKWKVTITSFVGKR